MKPGTNESRVSLLGQSVQRIARLWPFCRTDRTTAVPTGTPDTHSHMNRRAPRKTQIAASGDKQRLPERLADNWSWGPEIIKTVLFCLLAPPLLFYKFSNAFGDDAWSWWQWLLAGTGGFALSAYILLVLFGAWRRMRRGAVRRD